MKKILVIDNYDSFVNNIMQILRQNPKEFLLEKFFNTEIPLQRLDDYSGILISPGPGIPEEAGDLMKLIELCPPQTPLLGICLGHQALALAYGGRILQLPHPLHGHCSNLRLTDTADPILGNISQHSPVGRYHSWVVDPSSLPSCLKVSSLDEQGNIMSFYHTSRPVFGLQFHPESVLSQEGRIFIDNWLDLCL